MDHESQSSLKQLKDISTCPLDHYQAHLQDEPVIARAAQNRILHRYHRPIIRYLRHALKDMEAAEVLYQDFSVNFIAGRFRSFDPGKGRFREYLKRSLSNLVRDYRRKQRPWITIDQLDPVLLVEHSGTEEDDIAAFFSSDILARAFAVVNEEERARPSSILGTALRLKIKNDQQSWAEIATEISKLRETDVTEEKVKRAAYNARQILYMSIIDQIRRSLQNPTFDAVEQELIDLGLHSLCKKTLRRLREESMLSFAI